MGSTSSGRAAPLVLVLLASALALASLALWVLPERTESARAPTLPLAPADPAPSGPAPAALQNARAPAPPVASAERPPARTGRLVLQLVPPLPEDSVSITLTRADGKVEPELELTRASPRQELECEPGELTVSARTRGARALSSQPTHTAVRAGTTAFVELELAPSASLTGQVRDEAGSELADVAVALVRGGATQASAQSDALGRFALAPLPVGEYELVLGDPAGPLVPRAPLTLSASDGPRAFVVPVLLTLVVRVVDGDGAPIVGARLDGTGKPGGRLIGTSDAEGRLRAERLPPGDYRVYARHAELGRGTVAFALDAASSARELELVLYR